MLYCNSASCGPLCEQPFKLGLLDFAGHKKLLARQLLTYLINGCTTVQVIGCPYFTTFETFLIICSIVISLRSLKTSYYSSSLELSFKFLNSLSKSFLLNSTLMIFLECQINLIAISIVLLNRSSKFLIHNGSFIVFNPFTV